MIKLLLVAVGAGGAGLLLGLGVSKLAGGDASQTPVDAASTAAGGAGKSGRRPVAATKRRPKLRPHGSLAAVRVSATSGILHPAATRAGRLRQRARFNVRIVARNGGSLPVTLPRPALLVGGVRVRTDPSADAPGTRIGSLGAGRTAAVTLRFEIAGSQTTQLTSQGSARLIVAGKPLSVAVTLGPPVTVKPGG